MPLLISYRTETTIFGWAYLISYFIWNYHDNLDSVSADGFLPIPFYVPKILFLFSMYDLFLVGLGKKTSFIIQDIQPRKNCILSTYIYNDIILQYMESHLQTKFKQFHDACVKLKTLWWQRNGSFTKQMKHPVKFCPEVQGQ